MKKKKLLYMIFLMISIIITGTLAYFTIVTERTALVLTLGEQDEVLVTLEPFEIKGTLSSTVSYTGLEDYIQITAENFSAIPKKVLFYYRINSIDSTLISTKLKYSITSSSTIDGTYTEVKTGNFSTAAEGHDLTVYEFDIPANTTIFYRVFTYLDGNENVSSMAGSLIETEFRAEMEHIITPDLDEGMIPVKYFSDLETETAEFVTATNDEAWFDYENHIWANAILVTEESRTTYLGTTGVVVDNDDVLAYLVWIPRFEYRYNNLGTNYAGGTQNAPGAISINFIPSYVTIPTSSAYKIHPAFTFGDAEISGFWIGRDVITGSSETPRNNFSSDNSVDVLSNINQATMFETSLKFCGGTLSNGEVIFTGSDYYGTSSTFDSHMMKQSEWGALVYLAQSLYGVCSNETTCFEYTLSSSLYSESFNDITTVEQGRAFMQSVIINDSSSSPERTMGVLQYDSNFVYSGNTSGIGGDNSGFVGYIGDILYDTSGYIQMPPAKYYDRYTSTNLATACNGELCYGHALSETDGWYGRSNNNFITSASPWTAAKNINGEYASLTFGNSSGTANTDVFRVVILNPNGVSTGPTGATMLIEKANDASITTYSSGVTTEMYTFSQPATTQLGATTDYRYIGSSPNNYITFNDETWRIIGVFDGRIKIIKDTSIGSMMWDYKKKIGSATTNYGSNDWVDSQLMYMLNSSDIVTNVALKTGYTYDGTYVKDANSKIIYKKGCVPAETDGTSYSCTANSWSLNDTALSQVADEIYYLGGGDLSSLTTLSVPDYYIFERDDEKYNDVQSINWTGKVGLMYPSDYGYTFSYGVNSTCYNDLFTSCSSTSAKASWLYNSSITQWTHIPRADRDSTVFVVLKDGGTYDFYGITNKFGVRPVVYLKSDITLTGTGTSGDPYAIVS